MKNEKEKQQKGNVISNNMYMLGQLWKVCPLRVAGDILISIVRYARQYFYSIVFLRYILNSMQKGKSFESMELFIIISVIIFFIIEITTSIYYSRVREITEQTIYEGFNLNLFSQANNVEFACFENPEFYNKYTRASRAARARSKMLLASICEIIGSFLSSIFVLAAMFSIDKNAALIIVLPIILITFAGRSISRTRYKLNNDNILFNRKEDYVQRTIYSNNHAKEIRLSNIFNVLMSSFNDAVDNIIKNIKKYGFKLGVLRSIQGSLSGGVIFIAAVLYASYRILVSKTLLIGDYIVLINAITNLSSTISSFLTNVLSLSEYSLYIENLKEFMSYKPKIAEDQDGLMPKETNNTLSLRNISFTYDGQDKPVLKNINIDIRPKEKIAFVGHNGAGKTTLVKLIMRLYDVTEGEVLLNDENIKKYNVREYRNLFGTVFRDFKVISMSVAENVLMRDIEGEEDLGKVVYALKLSGAYDKVESLKNGIHTTLTKEFDREGAVLSGGEYQKIAIARVFAQDSQIAILDEPSSALDPIAEYKVYESMMKACENKSIIFISHRLSSAALADKIYMLENGEIIEKGSHEELMKLNGKYADMFRKQAENYVKEEAAV